MWSAGCRIRGIGRPESPSVRADVVADDAVVDGRGDVMGGAVRRDDAVHRSVVRAEEETIAGGDDNTVILSPLVARASFRNNGMAACGLQLAVEVGGGLGDSGWPEGDTVVVRVGIV